MLWRSHGTLPMHLAGIAIGGICKYFASHDKPRLCSIANGSDNTGHVDCSGNWRTKISRVIIKKSKFTVSPQLASSHSIFCIKSGIQNYTLAVIWIIYALHNYSAFPIIAPNSIYSIFSWTFGRLTEWRHSLNHYTKPHLVWSPVTFRDPERSHLPDKHTLWFCV